LPILSISSSFILSGCNAFAKTAVFTLHHDPYRTMDAFYITRQYFSLCGVREDIVVDIGRFLEPSHTRRHQKRFVVLSLRLYLSYSLLFIRESLYGASLHVILAHEFAQFWAEEKR